MEFPCFLKRQGSCTLSHHFRVFVRRICVRRPRSRLETLCSIHDARIRMTKDQLGKLHDGHGYMPRSGQACRTLPPRSGGFTVWPICCLEGGFPYKTVNPSHAHGAGKGHGGRPLRGKGHNGKPLRGNKTSTAASRSAAVRPPWIHSSSRTPSFPSWRRRCVARTRSS